MYDNCEHKNFVGINDISDTIRLQKPFYLKNKNRKVFQDEEGNFVMLKMFGERSLLQMAINETKPYFGLTKMDMMVVKDVFMNKNGSLIKFFPNAKKFSVKLFKKISNEKLARNLAKITLFDYVFGNNERFSSNLLFSNDYKEIYAIDEDDAFFYGRMQKRFYHPTFNALRSPINWYLEDEVKNIDVKFIEVFKKFIDEYGLNPDYVKFCEIRLKKIQENVLLFI